MSLCFPLISILRHDWGFADLLPEVAASSRKSRTVVRNRRFISPFRWIVVVACFEGWTLRMKLRAWDSCRVREATEFAYLAITRRDDDWLVLQSIQT